MARSHPKNVIAEFLRIGNRGLGGTNNNNLTELTRLCHLVPGRSRRSTVSGFTKLHPGKYIHSVKRRPLYKYGFNHMVLITFMLTSATLVQVTFPELRLVPSHLHVKTHKGVPTKRNLITGRMLIDMAHSHPKNVIAEFL